ncbi:hypothetical protein BJF85_21350 [Saccharomonospora sp. CUA-673]|nr:hypothetical protein BJF85_21350 [Saccharomonospora sp. CUA-673]
MGGQLQRAALGGLGLPGVAELAQRLCAGGVIAVAMVQCIIQCGQISQCGLGAGHVVCRAMARYSQLNVSLLRRRLTTRPIRHRA